MSLELLLGIYLGVVAGILLLSALAGKKNKKYYDGLDKKEHPFRFLYPAGAFLYIRGSRLFQKKPNQRVISKMKRL